MADKIKISTADFQQATADLLVLQDSLKRHKAEMQNKYSDVRAGWKGAAGAAFGDYSQIIVNKLEINIASLGHLINDIKQVHKELMETDALLAQSVISASFNSLFMGAKSMAGSLSSYMGVSYNNTLPTNADSSLVRSVFESRSDVEKVDWKRTESGKSTITITFKDKRDPQILYEGVDYYIGNNERAYFYNNVRTLLEAGGAKVDYTKYKYKEGSIITVSQKGMPPQTLVEGKDYYIGADGKAHFLDMTYGPLPPVASSAQWIPSSILEYNGSSEAAKYFRDYEKKFTRFEWNQEKIDSLWQACVEIDNSYGIQIDPRFLTAIIIQEGTGSFNTSATNKAADGQHGAETNYAVDLMKANHLIFGKILGYVYYGEEFRQAVSNNNDKPGINGNGDIFQYCNWYTPIIDTDKGIVRYGVYAGHGAWGDKVRVHYEALGGDAAGYEEYISNIDKSAVEKLAAELDITLPSLSFESDQNAQDSKGNPNGNWTVVKK